ncbi:MAG: NAD-dependent deacylase [Leptolyngbya sp. PLA3]|nr:MAG: NAD-dependent deacylase [Cyanobacteria bacterium CYA]MCE7969160.1 NAD-dependent deacylase [Leptolyngbya sp. PL-A3]
MTGEQRLIDALCKAHSVCVLTGAGISTESGVPTFRDPQEGLWAKYDPARLSTPEAFEDDPALVTRWYDERRLSILRCRPNPAHIALAELEHLVRDRGGSFTLVTQNIDRLHQRAGSAEPIELHGSLHVWRCTSTGRSFLPGPEPFSEYPPRSPSGSLYRPDVVWFGESLPERALERAWRAAQWCEVYIVVGTSSLVYPAAGLTEVACESDGLTAEVNLDPTPISDRVDVCLRGKASDILPRVVAGVKGGTQYTP